MNVRGDIFKIHEGVWIVLNVMMEVAFSYECNVYSKMTRMHVLERMH